MLMGPPLSFRSISIQLNSLCIEQQITLKRSPGCAPPLPQWLWFRSPLGTRASCLEQVTTTRCDSKLCVASVKRRITPSKCAASKRRGRKRKAAVGSKVDAKEGMLLEDEVGIAALAEATEESVAGMDMGLHKAPSLPKS